MSIMIPESSALFTEYLHDKYAGLLYAPHLHSCTVLIVKLYSFADDPENPYARYPYSQLLLGATFIILIFLDHIAMHFG